MEHCPCPPSRNSKKFPVQESAIHHSQTMTRASYFGAQNGGLMWRGRTLLSASSGEVMKKGDFCYLTLVQQLAMIRVDAVILPCCVSHNRDSGDGEGGG
ncbi:hypothetical protein NC651_027252 [Populus alba x Populus x berolinensis]|nr:hypothetical protein NC651_027252 [Populus alba x Populus x berolinensis]